MEEGPTLEEVMSRLEGLVAQTKAEALKGKEYGTTAEAQARLQRQGYELRLAATLANRGDLKGAMLMLDTLETAIMIAQSIVRRFLSWRVGSIYGFTATVFCRAGCSIFTISR